MISFNNATSEDSLCSSTPCGGGAVSLYDMSRIYLPEDSVLANNRSIFYPVLVLICAFLTKHAFSDLSSASGDGGAVFSCDLSTVQSHSLIERNTASGNGGGIASIGSSFVYIGNGANLQYNSAILHGGCLYAGGLGATLGCLDQHTFACHLTFNSCCLIS